MPIAAPPPTSRKADRPALFLGARTLASLALPPACPGCFYLRLRCGHDLPFQIPVPGIIRLTESLVRQAVHAAIEVRGALPGWMPDLGEVVGYIPKLDHRWYRFRDERTNVVVSGVPDDILVRPDRSLHIVDYKIARWSDLQSEIQPLYRAQTQVYAYIARRLGRRLPGPVTGLTIVYVEPLAGDPAELSFERAMTLGFETRPVFVPLEEEETIPALLREAREIADEAEALGGRAPRHVRGCRERERLLRLVEAERGAAPADALLREGLCLVCGRYRLLLEGMHFCAGCVTDEEPRVEWSSTGSLSPLRQAPGGQAPQTENAMAEQGLKRTGGVPSDRLERFAEAHGLTQEEALGTLIGEWEREQAFEAMSDEHARSLVSELRGRR